MNKRYCAVLMAFVIGISVFFAVEPAYAIAKAVYIDPMAVTLYVGDTKKVTMYVGGEASSADKWSSSNKKVATVSKKGMITAKKAGKATITCKTGFGYNLKCKVIIKKKLELSGYLNKSYKKLEKKTPEAKHLDENADPAGLGNVYVFETSSGTEPFYRYDKKRQRIQSIQISSVSGDSRQKRFTLYGVSLEMSVKKAKAALKAKKCAYVRKETYSGGRTHLIYKKSGHMITLFIEKGKVTTCQWSR